MSELTLLLRDEHGHIRPLEIHADAVVLGRDPICSVRSTDPAVSRRHASLCREDGEFVVQDQGSRAGTQVNGTRIRGPTAVREGDWIRLGNTFLLACPSEPGGEHRERLERLARVASAVPGSDGVEEQLESARVLLALPSVVVPSDETASATQLSMLTEVSRTLQSLTELDEILTVLLGVAFDLVSPQRGTILLRKSDSEELVPVIRHPESDEGPVSRTILRTAIERRSTLVVSEVKSDERFRGVASLETQSIQAVVCCPLISRAEVVGAMVLDARYQGINTRRDEIGLLNLVACYAATAIENALLLRDRSRARSLEDLDREPIVANSKAMSAVLRELEERAHSDDPLLIEGEAGTGKLLAARHLHLQGRGPGAPFIALDCLRLTARDLRTVLFGTADAEATATPSVRTQVRGGAWVEAAGGTLVLEHVGALDLLAQGVLADLLEDASGGGSAAAPRLVVTSSEKLSRLVEDRGFSGRLAEILGRDSIQVPRLRDRREDILVLARHFLHRTAEEKGEPARQLGASAEAPLVAGKYREANATELRGTMELAAILCDGSSVEAEHLFTGPKAREHRLEFDLGGSGIVRWFLGRKAHEVLHVASTAVFMILTAACLLWPDHAAGRVANAVVWGLWWPALLVLFLFVGRVWCTVCPLSRLARWSQSVFDLARRPPAWLKNNAAWVMAFLLGVILWAEHVFDMPHRPLATGFFLLILALVAAAFASFMQREVWCRFACPLGNLSAGYSVPATVHVHANPMICTSQCKTHECYKGSEEERGCPMFLHPLYLKDAHYCKLCMACVRSCPNGSARLWVRPPLLDVWSLSELNASLVPLALVAFLAAPVVLAASSKLPGFDGWMEFTGWMIGIGLLAVLLRRWTMRWFSRDGESMTGVRVAFALLILAWGPLMAFHLQHVPGLDALRLGVGEGVSSPLWPAAGLALLSVTQIAAVLLAASAASIVLWRIRARSASEAQPVPSRSWWLTVGVVVLYSLACGGLVV